MNPSVILIRTESKKKRFLTLRKTVAIGTDENADIIVNHQYLQDNLQTLNVSDPGGGINKREKDGTKGKKTRWFIDEPGLKVHYKSLKLPIAWTTIAFVAVAFLILILGTMARRSSIQDWSAIPLPTKEVHGFCRQDSNHPEGVIFSFNARAVEAHNLSFVLGGEGDGSTLSLSVNKNKQISIIKIPDGWGTTKLVKIPADLIQVGENSLEFHYFSPSPDFKRWGIRDVQSFRAVEQHMNNETAAQVLERVSIMLRKQTLEGPDLGYLYKTLNEISTPPNAKMLRSTKSHLLDTVQMKMLEKTQEAIFQIRSARALGDEELAGKMEIRMRDWIPDGWKEGWRILDGF